MIWKNFSRSSESSCLESFKPRSFRGRPDCNHAHGKTTAAAAAGPARGPQPASSTPATSVSPFCQSPDSCDRRCQYFAAMFRCAVKLPGGEPGATKHCSQSALNQFDRKSGEPNVELL